MWLVAIAAFLVALALCTSTLTRPLRELPDPPVTTAPPATRGGGR